MGRMSCPVKDDWTEINAKEEGAVRGTLFFFCPVQMRRIANLSQRHPRCADSEQRYFPVRRLPLRAEVTFYSVKNYVTLNYCLNAWMCKWLSKKYSNNQAIRQSSDRSGCRIFVPNVPLCAFRARGCVVPYSIVFRYVSLVFPFLKRKQKGKRANNERINDDAWVIAWMR